MVINKKTMLLAIILSSSACMHGSEEKDEKLSSSAAVKIEATDRENSRKAEKVRRLAEKNIRKMFFENNIEGKKSLAQEYEKIIDDLRVHTEMLKHFVDREREVKDRLERIQQELENPSDAFVEKRYENRLKHLEVLGVISTISNLKEDFRRKKLYEGAKKEILESFADKECIIAREQAVRHFNKAEEAPNVRVAKKAAAAAEKIQAVYRRKKAVELLEELPFREEK